MMPLQKSKASALWLLLPLGLVGCSGSGPTLEEAAPSTTLSAPAPTAPEIDGERTFQVVVAGDESSADALPAPPTGIAWVAVVAGASDPYDPILTDAKAGVDQLGFAARISNCDKGAAEAIGMATESTFTLAVPFNSRAEADEAADVLASNEIETVVAEVAVVCPD